MSLVVVDTDVASTLLRRRAPANLTRRLADTVGITFVTYGELTKWTLVRHWGPRSLETMRTAVLRRTNPKPRLDWADRAVFATHPATAPSIASPSPDHTGHRAALAPPPRTQAVDLPEPVRTTTD